MTSKHREPAADLNVLSTEPLAAGAHLQYLDQRITPNNHFFIRDHFPIPSLDRKNWRLRITGAVDNVFELDYQSLRDFPSQDVVCLMECAGNSRATMVPPAEGVTWDHGAVGTARWRGVPLRDVLNLASPKSACKHVLLHGEDFGKEQYAEGELAQTGLNYEMSLPMEKALHPDTLLAYQMNGEDLPPEHGFPIRVVTPGWYGMTSVKWLTGIELLTEDFDGFHQNDYHVHVAEGGSESTAGRRVTALQVKSLVTWPNRGAVLHPGTYTVRGVAWSGAEAISKVEVSTDDFRTWHSAKVE